MCSFRGTNQGRIPWICLNDRRMHPDVQHHSTSSEGSLAPPSPPLHKSCIRMKTSKKWWNDTDRGTNEAPIPVPRFPQHILTLRGLDRTQASAMRDRRHGLRHDTASIQHDGYESPRLHLDLTRYRSWPSAKLLLRYGEIVPRVLCRNGRVEPITTCTSLLFLKLFFLSSYSGLFHPLTADVAPDHTRWRGPSQRTFA